MTSSQVFVPSPELKGLNDEININIEDKYDE